MKMIKEYENGISVEAVAYTCARENILCPSQAAAPTTNNKIHPMPSDGTDHAKIAKGNNANVPAAPEKNCITCAFTVPANRLVMIEKTAIATALCNDNNAAQ